MIKQLEVDPEQDSRSSSESIDSNSASIPSATPQSGPPNVSLTDAGTIVRYANFCRVTGTPEELVLDFGLNVPPMGAAASVAIQQRLVVNYFTAKRLLQALAISIQRHEALFGVLETDVEKRISPALASR
jgi:hypothetical protein